MQALLTTIAAILAAVGGSTVVVIALSGWLARIIANRIAQQDRSRVDAELERLRANLARNTATELDALARRREVYTRLAKGLRIFVAGQTPDPESKAGFLEAYDEACIWAAEPVVAAIEGLIDEVRPGLVNQERTKKAYAKVIEEMRRDAGHPGTAISYRFITF